MNLIESIENLINESEDSASKTLDKIKTAIQNAKRPDFSKIKDGEHFMYHGIEFIRLGLEQGGVLCMTAKPIAEEAFDPPTVVTTGRSPVLVRSSTPSSFLGWMKTICFPLNPTSRLTTAIRPMVSAWTRSAFSPAISTASTVRSFRCLTSGCGRVRLGIAALPTLGAPTLCALSVLPVR